jgi:single-stranded-DNA-specific exonuclease
VQADVVFRTPRRRWLSPQRFWDAGLTLGDLLDQRRARIRHTYAAAFDEQPLHALPSAELLDGMGAAADRIVAAITQSEKLIIVGDYDVDGTTASALLIRFFRCYGIVPEVYIPNRMTEGYGLSPAVVEAVHARGARVLVTVDNGIAACEACELAREYGIDVVITDHHEPQAQIPLAFAVVNPKKPGCAFPYKHLSGVGVAFFLAIALRKRMAVLFPEVKPNLKSLLDLVAIGTIADVCPLDGLNHQLTRVGLEVLSHHVHPSTAAAPRPGLRALLQIAGVSASQPVRAEQIAFQIGPRLNAAGRLGTAMAAFEVMATDDPERAHVLADMLDAENRERRLMERSATNQIDTVLASDPSLLSGAGLMLFEPSWHPGLIGIIAARCLDRYYRPTLVLTQLDGVIKGSGRSTDEIDLFALLSPFSQRFISFGGHPKAVGFTLGVDRLAEFREFFDAATAAERDKGTMQQSSGLLVEGPLDPFEVNLEFVRKLGAIEPFGAANPRPKFVLKDVVVRDCKAIGKNPADGHCHITLSASASGEPLPFRLTAFGMRNELEAVRGAGQVIHAAIELSEGFWNGSSRLEARVADFGVVDSVSD